MSIRLGPGFDLGAAEGGVKVPPVLLSPPDSAFSGFPFSVYQQGASYAHDFDMAAVKPAPTTTYYVTKSGNDANVGTTQANAFRTLKKAMQAANSAGGTVRLLVEPGLYRSSITIGSNIETWVTTTLATASLIVEPLTAGRIIVAHDVALPAFAATSDANIHVSTYTTQTPTNLVDLANPDSAGKPRLLRKALAVADSANPWPEINVLHAQYPDHGACWFDGANRKCYARTANNRPPDTDIMALSSTGAGNLYAAPGAGFAMTIWARELETWGLQGLRVNGNATATIAVYAQNCAWLYTNSHGFGSTGCGGLMISHRCTVPDAGNDGYNYNCPSGTPLRFAELDCTAERSGWNTNADASLNATSAHSDCIGIRVNGRYSAANRVVHDIQNAKSWNLGCAAGPARVTPGISGSSANFVSGFAGLAGAARLWLEGCPSHPDSDYDCQAYDGGQLFTRTMDVSGFTNLVSGAGSAISTY